MKSMLSRLLGRPMPTPPLSRISDPSDAIGDILRAEAIQKCEEARELAERAGAQTGAYLIDCAIIELRDPRRRGDSRPASPEA